MRGIRRLLDRSNGSALCGLSLPCAMGDQLLLRPCTISTAPVRLASSGISVVVAADRTRSSGSSRSRPRDRVVIDERQSKRPCLLRHIVYLDGNERTGKPSSRSGSGAYFPNLSANRPPSTSICTFMTRSFPINVFNVANAFASDPPSSQQTEQDTTRASGR